MSGRRRSRGPLRGIFRCGRAPHSKEARHRRQTRRDTALGALSKPRQSGDMKFLLKFRRLHGSVVFV